MCTNPLHPPPHPCNSSPLFTVKFFQFLRYLKGDMPLHSLHPSTFPPHPFHRPFHLHIHIPLSHYIYNSFLHDHCGTVMIAPQLHWTMVGIEKHRKLQIIKSYFHEYSTIFHVTHDRYCQ